MGIFKDITGIQNGFLIPLKYIKGSHGKVGRWECKCHCGKKITLTTRDITSRGHRSCGCQARKNFKHEDLYLKKYGHLTPLKRFHPFVLDGKRMPCSWECKCDCGNIKRIPTRQIRSGTTIACGCHYNKYATWDIRLYASYKNSARNRKIKFNLDMEIFKIYVHSNCHYCGALPSNSGSLKLGKSGSKYADVDRKYNGIDRKDNKKGYEKNNCVTACKICNKAKLILSYADFILWIKRLSVYATDINFNYNGDQ